MPDALLVDQYGNPMVKDGLPVIIPNGHTADECVCCYTVDPPPTCPEHDTISIAITMISGWVMWLFEGSTWYKMTFSGVTGSGTYLIDMTNNYQAIGTGTLQVTEYNNFGTDGCPGSATLVRPSFSIDVGLSTTYTDDEQPIGYCWYKTFSLVWSADPPPSWWPLHALIAPFPAPVDAPCICSGSDTRSSTPFTYPLCGILDGPEGITADVFTYNS